MQFTQWTPAIPYTQPFDYAGSSDWYGNGKKAWSISTLDNNELRFEVRSGDVYSNKSYSDPKTSERSEVLKDTRWDDGAMIDIAYEFMMAPGHANTAKWLIVGQLHSDLNLSPPVDIGFEGDDHMLVHGNFTNAAGQVFYTYLYADPQPIVRGHWYRMQVQIQFTGANTGSVRVTRDGVEIVNYSGPIGYVKQTKSYWRHGIYRRAAPETLIVSYRNFKAT